MSEMETELMREKIENYAGSTDGVFAYYIVRDLARALLAEMDKPKVWDGAPDNAGFASVNFCKASGVPLQFGKTMFYTRALPKSRARVIAEEARTRYERGSVGAGSLDDVIESAILKALAEKEAGKC